GCALCRSSRRFTIYHLVVSSIFCCMMLAHALTSSRFPYTTLFRSKIVLVGFPQVEGYLVYVLLYHIAAKAVIVNMGGDKLSQLWVSQAGIVLFHNRCTHSVHNGVCALHLLSRYAVHIDFKVGHEPGKIRVGRQFTQEGIVHPPAFQ